VYRRNLGEHAFDGVALGILVNGLNRLISDLECRKAIGHVARCLIRLDQPTLIDICADIKCVKQKRLAPS
jgi:hypothetical protein